MMSRKHYNAIASVFATNRAATQYHPALSRSQRLASVTTLDILADDLATMLADDNPRFNRKQFIAACGVES